MKKTNITFTTILLALGCFALSPAAKADEPIVGLWDVHYTSDFGPQFETYDQWHSDGQEFDPIFGHFQRNTRFLGLIRLEFGCWEKPDKSGLIETCFSGNSDVIRVKSHHSLKSPARFVRVIASPHITLSLFCGAQKRQNPPA